MFYDTIVEFSVFSASFKENVIEEFEPKSMKIEYLETTEVRGL